MSTKQTISNNPAVQQMLAEGLKLLGEDAAIDVINQKLSLGKPLAAAATNIELSLKVRMAAVDRLTDQVHLQSIAILSHDAIGEAAIRKLDGPSTKLVHDCLKAPSMKTMPSYFAHIEERIEQLGVTPNQAPPRPSYPRR